jgi:P pilus assembly chaperone PapD
MGDGCTATNAQLRFPGDVFLDAAGNIFIADSDNDSIREVVKATGIIQTVAGNGSFGFSGDGGPATNARLDSPFGVFVDGANMFIADSDNNRIREVVFDTANLSANTLTFSAQGVGTPSAAQTITLTNPGANALAFTSATVSGANSGDFSVTNTCGTSVNGGANCTISVTFKPAAGGNSAALLTILSAAGSQEVTLTGVATDFSLTAPQTTATVTAGTPASVSLQIGVSGAQQTISLTCTGAPTAAVCVAPSSITVAAGQQAIVDIAVTTTKRGFAVPRVPPSTKPPLVWFVLASLLALLVAFAQQMRKRLQTMTRPAPAWIQFAPRVAISVCLIAIVATAVTLGGCGGGSASTPPQPTGMGTPAGTSTITVTGTSNGVSHTQQFTLTVQ